MDETNLAVREMRKISIIDEAPGPKQAKKLFLKPKYSLLRLNIE